MAHDYFYDQATGIQSGENRVPDPGDGNTIALEGKSDVYCEINSTSGLETRVLPDASTLGVGRRVTIAMNNNDGTSVTVSQPGDGAFNVDGHAAALFNSDGEWATFEVMQVSSAKLWRAVASDGATIS
jgi:hypothetical protein